MKREEWNLLLIVGYCSRSREYRTVPCCFLTPSFHRVSWHTIMPLAPMCIRCAMNTVTDFLKTPSFIPSFFRFLPSFLPPCFPSFLPPYCFPFVTPLRKQRKRRGDRICNKCHFAPGEDDRDTGGGCAYVKFAMQCTRWMQEEGKEKTEGREWFGTRSAASDEGAVVYIGVQVGCAIIISPATQVSGVSITTSIPAVVFFILPSSPITTCQREGT